MGSNDNAESERAEMRMGEKIWYCKRLSEDNAEADIYAKPIEMCLRMPTVFRPVGITVQPMNGFTDRLASGETTTKTQRIILTPYQIWHNKFKEGDLFYLDGEKPQDGEEYYGQNTNYYVDSVNNQNNAIEIIAKKIIDK